MAAKSSGVAQSAQREFVMTRIFDAPRELVFKAWIRNFLAEAAPKA
jgi:uncharacterized protein YndB with AHSA1/START domain